MYQTKEKIRLQFIVDIKTRISHLIVYFSCHCPKVFVNNKTEYSFIIFYDSGNIIYSHTSESNKTIHYM